MNTNPDHILDRLYQTLLERKKSGAEESYVASLYAKGTSKICGKIAEEAAETVFEAGRLEEALPNPAIREKLAHESADLIFHLMVLWAHKNIAPEDVFAILESRFGLSGHTEKAARGQ